MEVTLTEAQRELLQEVLDAAYRDLQYEIADTDLFSYKEMLRARRTLLGSILDLVGGTLPDHEPR